MSYILEPKWFTLRINCHNCTKQIEFSHSTPMGVIQLAKDSGWKFTEKITLDYKNIGICYCPECSTQTPSQSLGQAGYKYIVYYPPGCRIINGVEKTNDDIAKELIEVIGNRNVAIPWYDMVGWKIMCFNGTDWVEISPKVEK